MDDLVHFLRAQLADDERVAREAAHHDRAWQYADSGSGPTVRTGKLTEDLWSREGNPSVWTCDDVEDGCPDLASAWEAEGRHIARWDPARVLAEVEAKRRILAQYEAVREEVRNPVSAEHRMNARARQFQLEQVAPFLAQPYAGRPGWREEWRAGSGS